VPVAENLSPTAPSSRGSADVSPSPATPAITVLAPTGTGPSSVPTIRARHLKPPKDSRVYKVAMAYLALKAQGLKLQAISDTINVPKDTIQTYMKRAHAKGWLNPTKLDVEDQIELTIPERVVRNVNEFLDSRDKDVTIEAAKGVGIFKNHAAVKVDGQVGVGFALRVQVDLPQGIAALSPIQIRPGSVGGTPAIEAEIVDNDGGT